MYQKKKNKFLALPVWIFWDGNNVGTFSFTEDLFNPRFGGLKRHFKYKCIPELWNVMSKIALYDNMAVYR